MMYGLPTTPAELAQMTCEDMMHGYMILTPNQKKTWIRSAGKGGCIRLTQPPGDLNSMQINVYDPGARDFSRCNWIDKDHFDG